MSINASKVVKTIWLYVSSVEEELISPSTYHHECVGGTQDQKYPFLSPWNGPNFVFWVINAHNAHNPLKSCENYMLIYIQC